MVPQIVYDTNTLYVFAPSNSSRSLWVQSLKEGMWNLYFIIIIIIFTKKATDCMLKVPVWTAAWLYSGVTTAAEHCSKFSVTTDIFIVDFECLHQGNIVIENLSQWNYPGVI